MYPGERSNEKGTKCIDQEKIDYHPNASDELISAAEFYEERQYGLGNSLYSNYSNRPANLASRHIWKKKISR